MLNTTVNGQTILKRIGLLLLVRLAITGVSGGYPYSQFAIWHTRRIEKQVFSLLANNSNFKKFLWLTTK